MANIKGTVSDSRGIPIPGVTIILASRTINQMLLTDIFGNFNFVEPATGSYKLTAVHTPFNYISDKIVEFDATSLSDSVENFIINPFSNPTIIDHIINNKYVLLKYAQYIFLGYIGWFFFDNLIADNIFDLNLYKLDEIEVGRGAITYLVAVTTIAMAAILMLAAIMTGGKDLDRRFSLGKEILTLLIGILGTIIGFYFGSSNKTEGSNGNGTDSVQTTDVVIKPESPQIGKSFTLSTNIRGGTRPYTYSITFTPPIITNPINDKVSKNGRISEEFVISDTVKAITEAEFLIEGIDNDSTDYRTKGTLKIIK